MSKTYKEYKDEPLEAAESGATYNVQTDGGRAPLLQESAASRIVSSTMSVDEYFDELISSVRQDHANL